MEGNFSGVCPLSFHLVLRQALVSAFHCQQELFTSPPVSVSHLAVGIRRTPPHLTFYMGSGDGNQSPDWVARVFTHWATALALKDLLIYASLTTVANLKSRKCACLWVVDCFQYVGHLIFPVQSMDWFWSDTWRAFSCLLWMADVSAGSCSPVFVFSCFCDTR